MQRYGQVLKVRPEFRDEYVRHHAAVWPGVLAQLRRSNIRNYSIYLRDGILFAYFEYVGGDFAADMRAMAADPETQRWWALMEPMQEKWPTARPDEWWSTMTEVFHTDCNRDAARTAGPRRLRAGRVRRRAAVHARLGVGR